MWCGQSSPKHNLSWGKFIHLRNLLFTLCEWGFFCFVFQHTYIDSSAFDWCVKPNSINFSNTEPQNKQDWPTVCRSLLFVQLTLWFCCQANSKAPKVGQVFPCATHNNHSRLLFCLWTDPLRSWCYSLEKFNCSTECSSQGVWVVKVPPTKWVDKVPPAHPKWLQKEDIAETAVHFVFKWGFEVNPVSNNSRMLETAYFEDIASACMALKRGL